MCGAGSEQLTRGEQRKQLLDQRDQKIAALMRQNRPVAAIAKIVGVETDYARKATRRIAEAEGIDYQPVKEGPGGLLTEASREYRGRLANIVYAYRNRPGLHPLEIADKLGLTQAQQIHASERPFRHDFTVSELERLAEAHDLSFRQLQVRALFSEEEYRKIARCVNI